MWQAYTASGYRDILTKVVEAATSKHVSAVAINAGGTGYSVGDILTVTHAGAVLDCTVEVTSVSGTTVDGIKLRNMGAFSSRLSSIDSIVAGGTGYAVNEILQVQGGTYTQRAKIKVTGVSAGVITSAAIFEGGGAYTASSEPGDPVSVVSIGPNGHAGNDDATFNVSWTGLVGTTGVSTTVSPAGGSGCTLDLTLTDTGWTAVRDNNDYSFNSVLDEKQVVLEGTVSGGDQPFCGYRSYTALEGGSDRWGILLCGMTGHNEGTAFAGNPNFGPEGTPNGTNGAYLPLFDTSQDMWMSITGRKIWFNVKCVGASTTSYVQCYNGLGNPLGTTTENPFPFLCAGATAVYNKPPDDATTFITGITEAVYVGGYTGPIFLFRVSDLSWVVCGNSTGSAARLGHPIYPVGEPRHVNSSDWSYIVDDGPFTFFDGICLNDQDPATDRLYPAPDSGGDIAIMIPVTQMRTPDSTNTVDNDTHAEYDNIFWVSATKSDGTSISAEDTFTEGTDRYRVFPCAHRSERYSYYAVKEA